MLLDTYLPDYQFHERHRLAIDASPERILLAIREVTPTEIGLWRTLFGLRTLPARLLRRRRDRARESPQPLLAQMRRMGFVVLGEEPGTELVLGAVGQPWRPAGGTVPAIAGPEDFRRFEGRGYAKMAMNFHLQPLPAAGRVLLSTETRVRLTDEGARRRFGAYWRLIGPFSALLRLTMLRAIKRRAEAR